MSKKHQLFYDIKSLPLSFTLTMLREKIEWEHTIYYDSSRGGDPPQWMDLEKEIGLDPKDYKIIDVHQPIAPE